MCSKIDFDVVKINKVEEFLSDYNGSRFLIYNKPIFCIIITNNIIINKLMIINVLSTHLFLTKSVFLFSILFTFVSLLVPLLSSSSNTKS